MKAFLAGLAVAVALSGCSSGRAPAPSATSIPSATPTDASDLAALLPGTVPAGYTAVAEQSGPLTIEEAAADADHPEAERRRLEENGFRRGYARTWKNEADDVLIFLVDEFASAEGAGKEFDASVAEATETGASRFAVSGIDGAVGLTQTEEGLTFHAVAFARGSRLFVAVVGGAPGTHDPKEAVSLAQRIVALL